LNKGGNKLFDILVGNQSRGLGERLAGLLLDISLRVPNGLSEDRDNVGHEFGGLLRCTDDELIEDGEGTSLDLPLAGSLDLMKKRRQ
jgi:hypothetical protein